MILGQPLDSKKIQSMSEPERIALLKAAYNEFIEVVNGVKIHQKDILEKALKDVEQKKIDQIRALIQSLPN
ncbi:MAG: hypothetical protein HYV33_06300 [Candidatus Kerfeldbacteria bacterium]|nr:hypothetical protein [Candidatus Kerfeldbacteria bacterium]